jgi:hypothetical protein
MLHVTPRARNELHDLLIEALHHQPEATTPGTAIRLIVGSPDRPPGLALALDAVRPTDEVVEHEGRTVLVVDALVSHLLETLTLDVVETPDGAQLELRG